MPLPAVTINLAQTESILVEYLNNADVIWIKSRSGNIACNGQVASPQAPVEFRDGLESLPIP